jgi:predicted nucleotidyltransferase
MNILFKEHLDVISSLLKHHVDFMLVGGYAVIHYGYRRTTGDMDLWIMPDNKNKEKLIGLLKEMNFDSEELNELNSLDFTKHIVFSIGEEPYKVDFMTYVNMVKWEEADKEKIYIEIENLKIPVIHLNHLILSKINNNRLKDKSDVEELQKIQKGKQK